jgi:putative methanogenesis marker protein 8
MYPGNREAPVISVPCEPKEPKIHVMEAIGRCRIVVRDGKVIEVGTPLIGSCPLARRFGIPVDPITPGRVRENIEHRMRTFGLCTPERKVTMEGEFVGFGASELLSFALMRGILDCAVIAADGAGTVVAPTPDLVQGIGGRMSGLVRTCPYPEVIGRIEKAGGIVLDPDAGTIDQVEGAMLAYKKGYNRVGITLASADEALAIRRIYPRAFLIAVHTTGISAETALIFAETCDLVTSCASRHVREVAGPRALLQAGSSIPVFAMTRAGKDLLLEKVRDQDQPMVLMAAALPFGVGNLPEPLV